MDGSIRAAGSKLPFALIVLALVVEGFDLQAANFAAPDIVQTLGIDRADVGPLLSASLVGVLLGAAFVGPLGDTKGRKRVIVWCCVAYGMLSLLAALATNLWQLIALRFLIGVGLGGVLPNALALAGEYAQVRNRAKAMGLVGIGITFGGVLAGAIAARLIPAYGWPGLFVVGGILPLVIAALVAWLLPKEPPVVDEPADDHEKAGLRALLSARELWRTLAIWTIFASVLMNVYLLSGWIPLLMEDAGFSPAHAALIGSAYHAGGVVGGVIASLLLGERRWLVVSAFALLSALSLAVLGANAWGPTGVTALIILIGLLVTGTQNAINGATGDTYPTRLRSTGLGWALGVGRIGSIAGPLMGSVVILVGLNEPRHFFFVPVLPLLLAALCALWLLTVGRRPTPLEEPA